MVIPLMGRFEGDTEIRHCLQAVINQTASKLKVWWWLDRLNDDFIKQGHRNGPVC